MGIEGLPAMRLTCKTVKGFTEGTFTEFKEIHDYQQSRTRTFAEHQNHWRACMKPDDSLDLDKLDKLQF